jgi:hypothetical protein
MSQLRKLKRNVERTGNGAEAEAEVPANHRELPVGKMLTSPVKGDFLAFPIFGYAARRAGDRVPLVMLNLMLIPSLDNPKPCGILEITLPFIETTETATYGTLHRFGWDGRVWPDDEGWPSGDTMGEEQLRALMEQGNVHSTLTFPPNDQGGFSAQELTVSRAVGPFLMPPLPEHQGVVDPQKMDRLRALWDR